LQVLVVTNTDLKMSVAFRK